MRGHHTLWLRKGFSEDNREWMSSTTVVVDG